MITVTISGADTSSTLTVSDYGRSGYTLRSINPGGEQREITVATSRWVDGAALTSTKDAMTTLDMAVQVWGTSYADLMAKIATLGAQLGQWGYTVTVTPTAGTASVYTCLPASYAIDHDPRTLRGHMAVVTASIPRQP